MFYNFYAVHCKMRVWGNGLGVEGGGGGGSYEVHWNTCKYTSSHRKEQKCHFALLEFIIIV